MRLPKLEVSLLGKKITAITAALILIAVGYYITRQKIAPSPDEAAQLQEISSPGDAIPSIDGVSAYMLINADDTRSLHAVLSFIPDLADKIGKFPELGIPGVDAGNIAETINFFANMRDITGASNAMTLYVTSSDVPGLYLSMFVDDEKFDPLMTNADRQLAETEEWTDREGEGGAWILRPTAGDIDTLYVTRAHIGNTSVVHISNEEKGIQAMSAAAADPSKRLNIERLTEEPNFIRIKLDEPIDMEGQKLSETELSWSRSDERVSIRLFSDIFDNISDKMADSDFTPKAPPVIGNGELAILASFDPMFMVYTIMPNEDDPARVFFERFGGAIPSQFAGDLEAILRQCRISAAIVTSGDVISTAYLTIDTAAEDAVDKLYVWANLFLGAGTELEGWDSVLNVPTGTPLTAILARRGGTVLLGAGDFAELEHSPEIPGNLEMIASRSNAFGVMAVPSRLMVNEGFLAGILISGVEAFLDRLPGIAEFDGAADFGRIENFTVTQAMDGNIHIDISIRK